MHVTKNILLWILSIFICGNSYAEEEFARETGPDGRPLTKSFLLDNLRNVSTEEEAATVLNRTRFNSYRIGLSFSEIKSLPERSLATISPVAAIYILRNYYKLDQREVITLNASEALWSKAGLMPIRVYGALWLGLGIATYAYAWPLVFALPLAAGGFAFALEDFKYSGITAKRTFEETGISLNPKHIHSIKALIEACTAG